MEYVQQTNCREWQFKNIPEFRYGRMSPLFADCGNGLRVTAEDDTSESSFMHTFTDVDEAEALAYIRELGDSALSEVFSNSISENLFYQYRTDEGLLYFSYLKNGRTVRIILDRCACADCKSFGYSEYEQYAESTVFAQYSLHYDDMIKGTTCDCGMNYVLRLRDNSLILIDGGEMEQATDIAIGDHLSFLRELTGTSDNEKMRISLYICTHPHNDHCDFFSKLLRFHSEKFELERVLFNFANHQNVRNSSSVALLRERISEKFPHAEYLKAHAGSAFSIANAEIDVLLSNEDTYGNDPEDPFPGTNDTSVVFSITAEGTKLLFLADCGDKNGSVLTLNYDKTALDCDFLQAAHHGINRIYDVYEKIDTPTVLLPQCEMNMNTRFSEILGHLNERYGAENIRFAHNRTDIFTLKNGEISSSTRAHCGCAYDGSEW